MFWNRELELELGDRDLGRVQNCLHRLASLQIEARAEAKPIEQLEGQCCQPLSILYGRL
jgi:hypothetical protein